jgi:hypothetical protein
MTYVKAHPLHYGMLIDRKVTTHHYHREEKMTRADMFVNPVREDWMTDGLIAKIKGVAQDGKITCAAAQQFARDNGIAMNKMKSFVDVVGLKVQNCQLGCF